MRAILQLLSEQTRPADEIIICDDTGVYQSPFAEVVDMIPNGGIVCSGVQPGTNGVSVARNKGIEAATSDIMLLLDDDSLPHKHLLEVHEWVHGSLGKTHPGKEFAVLGQRDPTYHNLQRHIPIGLLSDKARRENTDRLSWGNFISNNLSFRRSAFMDVGGFDEDFAQPNEYGWEDIELGIRWFQAGYGMAYCPDALIYHPDVPRTSEKQERADRAWRRMASKHPEVLRGER